MYAKVKHNYELAVLLKAIIKISVFPLTRLLALKFLRHVSSSFFSLQSRTACVLVVSARIKRPWRSPSCAWRVLCMSPRRVSRLRGNL